MRFQATTVAGTLRTAFPTEYCVFSDRIVYQSAYQSSVTAYAGSPLPEHAAGTQHFIILKILPDTFYSNLNNTTLKYNCGLDFFVYYAIILSICREKPDFGLFSTPHVQFQFQGGLS